MAAVWAVLLMLSTLGYGQLPNIVVIVADDVGLGDIGRQHTERTGLAPLAPTPNLDALADEGMWFTDAHSPTALCAPSRYAFMSGNYNYRSYKPGGVWNAYDQSAIATNDVTLGSITRDAGYTTGFVGKWHMGGDYYVAGSTTTISRIGDDGATPAQIDLTTRVGGGPQSVGFDYDFTVATGVQGPVYVAHENAVWAPFDLGSALIYYDTNTASDPLFLSDKGPGVGDSNWDSRALNMLLADKAAAFITNSAATSSQPFCLYYCSPAVHLPHLPIASIDGDAIAGTTPSAHTDMNRVLDLEVKRIVDAVKATGEYDDTLIIFTSDNGGLHDPVAQAAGHRSNGGYRGTKNSAFEGGHRVPFIAVWPDVIPTNTRCNSMINGTDILATLAAITATRYPEGQVKDSYNLLPILEGDTNHVPRVELVLQAGSLNELMFRQGPWKLIMSSSAGPNLLVKADTTPTHLFNLDDDPTEPDVQNRVNDPAYTNMVLTMYERYWELRESTNRTAPSYVASITPASELECIIDEDFSLLATGDTTEINQQITNLTHNTGLRFNNHAVGEIVTNSAFGTGNVLQLSTGTNASGGFGAMSAANNPYPVTFTEGEGVVLSFGMLVQALPEGASGINIELSMTGANDISRPFTEYYTADTGDVVNVSWSTTVDADMTNATDISIWIPIEGISGNYSTVGPNGDGTEIDVMQLDNIKLGIVPEFLNSVDAVWSGAVDTVWADGGNWDPAVPGSNKNAIFNNAGNGNTTVDLGAEGATIKGLYFDDAACAAYTIGSGGAGSQTLTISNLSGNVIQLANDVGNNQVIDADVTSAGGYSIHNFSTSGKSLTINGDLTTAGAQSIFMVEGATINLNGADNTATTTSQTGPGTINANSISTNVLDIHSGTFVLNNDQVISSLLFNSGTIAPHDALFQIGAANTVDLGGSIVSSATPAETNAAVITNGTLRLTLNRDVFVSENALVSGAELTIQSDITDDGGFRRIQKGSPGTLRLAGSNSFAVLSILAGTVQIADDWNLGTGALQLGAFGATDGTLEYLGAGGTIDNEVRVGQDDAALTGAGSILANGSGAVTFTGNVDGRIGVTVTRTLVFGGASTADNTFSGNIVDNNTAGGGRVAVRKQDAGAWRLSGTNTYTGNTTVETGRLDVAGTFTSAITVEDGATLGGEGSTSSNVIFGTSTSSTLAIDGSTAAAFETEANLNTDNGVSVLLEVRGAGAIKVIDYSTWGGSLGDFSLDPASVPVSPRGPGIGFADTGGGITLDMGYEDKTWTGADGANPTHWNEVTSTNWTGGSDALYYDGDAVLFADTRAGLVDLQTSLQPHSATFSNTSGLDYVLTNSTLEATAGIVVSGGGDVTIHSVVAGAGGIDKTAAGTGTLTLASANTYSGGTTLRSGTTVASNNAAFGSGSVRLGAGGTSFAWLTLADGVDVANTLTVLDDDTTKHLTMVPGGDGHAEWSGDITIHESELFKFQVSAAQLSGTRILELSGNINAPRLLVFDDSTVAGVIYLTGDNDFNGGVIRMRDWRSHLRVGNNNAIDNAIVELDELTSMQLVNGISTDASGALRVTDTTDEVKTIEILDQDGGLSESATFNGPVEIMENTIGTFLVKAASGDTLTLAGAIVGFGDAGIVKAGGGDAILTGTNTYSAGPVDVQAGTLWINGDSSGCSGGLQVLDTAVLGGSGSWGGSITNRGGSGLTWRLLDNADQDGLDVSGNCLFSGTNALTLTFNGDGSSVDWADPFWKDKRHEWTLIDVGGTLSGVANLSLKKEAWPDSQGQSFKTVRSDSRFLLRQRENKLTLVYLPPGGLSLIIH